jgi:transposase-like protein
MEAIKNNAVFVPFVSASNASNYNDLLRRPMASNMVNNISVHVRDRCPRCGSTDFRTKTKNIYNKILGTHVSLLICKNCGYQFKSAIVERHASKQIPDNLIDAYLKVRSIKALKETLGLSVSHATVHRWLLKQLDTFPSWENLLSEPFRRSHIMGLDMTVIKVGKQKFNYLHVVDFPNNHMAYQLLPSKSAENVEQVLLKLRAADYWPVVVVTDLAKEVVQTVKKVYPQVVIQGCLFHLLMWLNKKLPTKSIRDKEPKKANFWNEIKEVMVKAASAKDSEERGNCVKELEYLTSHEGADKRIKMVVNSFLKNVKYYHVMDELRIFGCNPEWRFNNACERAMQTVKQLARKMYGFKDPQLAQKYINALWATQRKKTDNETSNHQSHIIHMTLIPYLSSSYIETALIHLTAKALNIKEEKLIEQLGYIAVRDFAFNKDYIEAMRKIIFARQPKTLQDLVNATGLDIHVASELATAIGIRARYVALDPVGVYLDYTGCNV